MTKLIRAISALALGAAVVLGGSSAGLAQDTSEDPTVAQAQSGAAPEAQQRGTTIEEIVVTATKREQLIQEVPIAVSAFPGDELRSRGIEDLEGLRNVSPSLSVYSSNSETNGGTLRIRGMGTTGNNPGLEAAVGAFIDGIYRSRSGLAFSSLLDIDRVEVLRGPQGTLFGKNTSAGAVHVITRKPALELGYSGSFTIGNMGRESANFSVTGPLIDEQLAFRIAGMFDQGEGFYDDVRSSDKFSDRDRWTLKGQLLWTPSDTVDVRFIYDYTDRDETCCPAVFRFAAPDDPATPTLEAGASIAALGGFVPPNGQHKQDSLDAGTNADPIEDVEDWGFSAEINWDLDFGTLTSITGWRDFDVFRSQDVDFTDVDVLRPASADEAIDNWSQEIRLVGTAGGLDWLVGFYGYTEDISTDGAVLFGTQGGAHIENGTGLPAVLFPDGAGYTEDYEQDTRGWSLFTHNTWHLSDRFSITGGARWSVETKHGKGIINGAAPGTVVNEPWCSVPIADVNGDGVVEQLGQLGRLVALCDNASFKSDQTEREWSGTFKLGYRLTDDLNSYASYSRGYKAGGYNLDQEANDFDRFTGTFIDQSRFDPEFADSYELGFKGTFLSDQLSVNSAIFYTEFEDFQLNTFTGIGFFISNVPEVTSRGVEVESFFRLAPGLQGSLGATYAVTRYGNNLAPAADPNAKDLNGRLITQSPRVQGSASLLFEQPIPGMAWFFFTNTNVSYRGEHNTGSDLDTIKKAKAYWLANAQVGIRSQDDKWEAYLWSTNLTDKRYDSLVFDSVFQTGSWHTFMGAPRRWGVTVAYRYL